MARVTSSGPATAPIQMVGDISQMTREEIKQKLEELRGKRVANPGSSKQGSRTDTVRAKKESAIEEEAI